jgi:hypothetical protein
MNNNISNNIVHMPNHNSNSMNSMNMNMNMANHKKGLYAIDLSGRWCGY